VKEKKKSTDLRELMAFEPVILVIRGIVSRMTWRVLACPVRMLTIRMI